MHLSENYTLTRLVKSGSMETSKYSNYAEKRRSEIMKRFIKSAIACIAAVAMIATVAPVTTQAAAKAVTVTNQKQLEAAIAQTDTWDQTAMNAFFARTMGACDGHATERIIAWMRARHE